MLKANRNGIVGVVVDVSDRIELVEGFEDEPVWCAGRQRRYQSDITASSNQQGW
jgi:hypothetical protein